VRWWRAEARPEHLGVAAGQSPTAWTLGDKGEREVSLIDERIEPLHRRSVFPMPFGRQLHLFGPRSPGTAAAVRQFNTRIAPADSVFRYASVETEARA
jgi:hypothetical protein